MMLAIRSGQRSFVLTELVGYELPTHSWSNAASYVICNITTFSATFIIILTFLPNCPMILGMKKEFSHWSTIIEIIAAGVTRNADRVASYADILANHLDDTQDPGDHRIAERIRSKLSSSMPRTSRGVTSLSPSSVSPAQAVFAPVDAESRSPFVDELPFPYVEVPILPPDAARDLERFVRLRKQEDRFLREGLPAPRSLLVYGPPGTGKTTIANFVAQQLKLPLLTVRLDAVMSSYLGTTAKNLRMVFEHAARRGGVLFLDEFDALAKLRDDANEVGEIKRIVNSLIQDMDAFPTMPVIAATNHEHLLDPAIWRRFDTIIPVPMPGIGDRLALLLHFLDGHGVLPKAASTEGSDSPRMLAAASLEPGSRLPVTEGKRKSASRKRREDSQIPVSEQLEVEDTADMIGSEELALLAEICRGCTGADLKEIVIRARQEHVLDSGTAIGTALIWEMWRFVVRLERQGVPSAKSSDERADLISFIDQHTTIKPPARVVSRLTGIPGSTIARLRQQSVSVS